MPPDDVNALRALSSANRRTFSAEADVALRTYLATGPDLRALPPPDAETSRTRFHLAAESIREIDRQAGAEAREPAIVAAVAWWIHVGSRGFAGT